MNMRKNGNIDCIICIIEVTHLLTTSFTTLFNKMKINENFATGVLANSGTGNQRTEAI